MLTEREQEKEYIDKQKLLERIEHDIRFNQRFNRQRYKGALSALRELHQIIQSGTFDDHSAQSSPVQGYRETLIDRLADLNRYDDDDFASPLCIDELPEADVAEVMDWLDTLLRACAANVYDTIEDDGYLRTDAEQNKLEGKPQGWTVKDCKTCDGQGELYGNLDESWTCPDCEGEGVDYDTIELEGSKPE